MVIDYRGDQEAPKLTPLPAGYSGVSTAQGQASAAQTNSTQAGAIADQNQTQPLNDSPEEKNNVGFFESIGNWFKSVLHF